MSNKPIAFVIMPFDEEFNDVYGSFIKPVLESAGFKVDRADDIESQQNIIKDILQGINNSDLIIADLTGGNPNVFYELGLAHAFRKPVILATQSIEDVPFDLRSYRLLEYSTHFVKIENAREKLTNYANGFLKKKLPYGSPVTDFLPYYGQSNRVPETEPQETAEQDERGFLDHLIDINKGYSRLAEIIANVTRAQQEMTQSVEGATGEFTRISASPNASSPAAARTVSRRLAERMGAFNVRLEKANDEYTVIAEDIEDSLEFVVSFQLEQSDANEPEVEEQLSLLRSLRSVAIDSRDSYLNLANTMAELPRMERRLNREVTRVSEQIRAMASNFDRTIASISRALKDYD